MPPHILFWNDSLDFGFVSLSLSQTLVFCFANITLERTETTRKISIFKKYIYVLIPFSKPFESPENGTALSIK